MWRDALSDVLQMPLVNADRLFTSILPEPDKAGFLKPWADQLRNTDPSWLRVAQQGVTSFVGHAMAAKVPFAMETVFSDERTLDNGHVATKIDLVEEMQAAGYFVLLFFVGLMSSDLSVLRVQTRVEAGGHGIPEQRLRDRFPRTQRIVGRAALIADATIMADNSREAARAFTVARVQLKDRQLFDMRVGVKKVPPPISIWLDVVAPDFEG